MQKHIYDEISEWRLWGFHLFFNYIALNLIDWSKFQRWEIYVPLSQMKFHFWLQQYEGLFPCSEMKNEMLNILK